MPAGVGAAGDQRVPVLGCRLNQYHDRRRDSGADHRVKKEHTAEGSDSGSDRVCAWGCHPSSRCCALTRDASFHRQGSVLRVLAAILVLRRWGLALFSQPVGVYRSSCIDRCSAPGIVHVVCPLVATSPGGYTDFELVRDDSLFGCSDPVHHDVRLIQILVGERSQRPYVETDSYKIPSDPRTAMKAPTECEAWLALTEVGQFGHKDIS